MRHSNDAWPAEREKALRALVADGLSSSQIAKQLGGGLTRSAVIGKIARLKIGNTRPEKPYALTSNPKQRQRDTARAAGVAARLVARQNAPQPPAEHAPVRPAVGPVCATPLWALAPRGCRWPGNDGVPEFLHCNAPQVHGSPYCAHHAARAVQPVGG